MDIEANDLALPKNTILNGEFLIEEVYYLGEQGIVYFGENVSSGKEIVIKEFMPYRCANRDLDGKKVVCKSSITRQKLEFGRYAFEQECKSAQLLKNLKEPYEGCVLEYIDSFEENNTLYLVMSKIQGCNLDECMDELDVEEKWNIITDMIDIIEKIHEKGIVHCDIKPSNIIVRSDGKVSLIDFGNSRILNDRKEGLQFASRGYSAPELYEGTKVDVTTDIYSLGAMIYHMLTGYQLPKITDYDENEHIPSIGEFIDITKEKEDIIMMSLNRNKKKRPKSLILLK